MNPVKRILRPFMFVAVVGAQSHFALAATTPDVWTAYLSTQGQRAAWAATVRGEGRRARGRDPVAQEDPLGDLKSVANAIRADSDPHDVIIPLGWVGSGKNQRQVDRLVGDLKEQKAGAMQQSLTAQVVDLERSYKAGRIYWQVGNEINSRHMTESLNTALENPDGPLYDDAATIPIYAEYIFAPTVDALEEAGRQLGGGKGRVKIILGTIANAHRPSSRQWLDQLMNYRIKGKFSPRLAGTRVADHVSIVAVHYVVTTDDPPWESIFDELDRKWRKPGIIEGVWGTEEIGGKLASSGMGAATAVRVAAAYVSRAARLQLPSSALRCSFFGWRWGGPGRSADFGMQILLDALGRTRVADLSAQVGIEGTGTLRAYALAAADGARISVVFNSGSTDAHLIAIALPKSDASPATQVIASLLTARGTQLEDLSTETVLGRQRYRMNVPVTLAPGETLVLRERS